MTDVVVRLLTLPEVAERLAVSQRTVQYLVERGQLRALRIGRARRVTESELRAFIAAREREARRGA